MSRRDRIQAYCTICLNSLKKKDDKFRCPDCLQSAHMECLASFEFFPEQTFKYPPTSRQPNTPTRKVKLEHE